MNNIKDLKEAERIQDVARAADYAIAVLIVKITQLPKESLESLFELATELMKTDSAKEREEIGETMKEIILPSLIGELEEGAPPKKGLLPLKKRSEWIGQKIKTARVEMGWTQVKLAEEADLPQSHISRLEAGKHSPSDRTLQKIAKALNVPLTQLDYEPDE